MEKALFKKILVALDNSIYSDYGMETAISIGKAFSAVVTGCHVYAAMLHENRFRDMETGLPSRYQTEEILSRQREIHQDLIGKGLEVISDSYLDRFEKQCLDLGVAYKRKNREGKNFVEISKEAEEHSYDLIVIGSLGMGVTMNSLIGSVCERVTRKTRKDILAVKDGSALKGKIIVAIDGSPYSFWALKIALELKNAFALDIEAIAAFDPYFHQVAFKNIAGALSEGAAKVFRFKEQEQLHEEIIDKGLAKLYQEHLDTAYMIAKREGHEIKTTLLSGKAYDELLKYIRLTKPSLLVLGRFGLHEVPESDLGNNTENLLRLAPCNVFVGGKRLYPGKIIQDQPELATVIEWDESAIDRLKKVPPFAKGMAMKAIENYAKEHGKRRVTEEIMGEAAKRLLPPQARKAMGIDDDN